ncbi:hypothetical protein [Aliihoeflea sp. 2WW]|uniref:hypothetical protein n=1 Tax=Aliihoeflea sp. 2WW TaxID=1381123 RepID=UPI0012679842|nr:hypothetical protein [Aliihoeflea sp. 2WW]
MAVERRTAVFHHINHFWIAGSQSPDMHDGPFHSRKEAIDAARAMQIAAEADPDHVDIIDENDHAAMAKYLR